MKPVDITGERFGRLVAVERKGTYWLCLCDCGNTKEVYRGNLKQANTLSCGCYKREVNKLKYQQINLKLWGKITEASKTLNAKYNYYKRNAKVRGLAFDPTKEEFSLVIKEPCHYCQTTDSVGIDRVDNTRGYITGNMVPCCKRCNMAKNDMDKKDFVDWVHRVHNTLQSRERKV
jgi:hypothetical protein